MKYFRTSLLFVLSLLTLIIYILGLFIHVMDIDASQYASISREMLETGSFLVVKHRYHDYLDKPPLLFWLSALSFKLGSVTNLFYKLPSFLGTLLGLFSCYKLGKLLYNSTVGMLAAWLLATCQAWFLFNHDVRTDTLLAGGVIFGIWQWTAYLKFQKTIYFISGCLGISIAMLAKGPIGLMVPVLALGSQLVYQREWKIILQWKWLLALGIVLVLLTPMLYGLYQQYGGYGLYFYFWEQSFGRLTGQNAFVKSQEIPQPIDPFFFTHTFLWAFLPWSLWAVYAVFYQGDRLVKNRCKLSENLEVLTLGGILFPFIALSLAQYKLPHYIFVFFPLVAILTAHCIDDLLTTNQRKMLTYLMRAQAFVCVVLWTLLLLLGTIVFPLKSRYVWVLLACLLLANVYFFSQGKNIATRLLLPSTFAIIGVNLFLNVHFYPTLLQYQAGSVVGQWVYEKGIPKDQFYLLHTQSHALDFYAQRIAPSFKNVQELLEWKEKIPKDLWVFTDEAGILALERQGLVPAEQFEFKDFPITTLTYEFLNPATRESTLDSYYLIRL